MKSNREVAEELVKHHGPGEIFTTVGLTNAITAALDAKDRDSCNTELLNTINSKLDTLLHAVRHSVAPSDYEIAKQRAQLAEPYKAAQASQVGKERGGV